MQQHDLEIARAEFVPTGDGTRAYYAVPAGAGPFPGVLVFPEAFGANDYIQSEVQRLARHGYAAASPDIFDGQTFSYDDRESIFPRLRTLSDERMLACITAGADFLRAQPQVKKGPFGAVGFCMGGRLSVLTSIALGDRIAAAASFYGGGIAPQEARLFPTLTDRLGDVKAELLLLYGGQDQSIAPDEHGRVAQTLSEHKKAFTLTVFPGGKHGFASSGRPDVYDGAIAEAAWDRTLELFARTLR